MQIVKMFKETLIKFKHYGTKGAIRYVLDFVPSRLRKRRQRLFFLHNYAAHPMEPVDGITVIGDLTARGSIHKALRDFVRSLKDAGINYQTYDTCTKPNIPKEDVADILTPRADFRLRRFSRIVSMFGNPLPPELNLDVSVIYFWEFTSAFLQAHPESLSCSSVIGMSDFNVNYFRSILPDEIPVHKILYPFRLVSPNRSALAKVRARYHLDDSSYKVFFNFALSSSYERKNPDGAMQAFAKAFQGKNDTKLIFKVSGCAGHTKELRQLRRLAGQFGIEDRFVVIEDYLAHEEIYALTAICDVYLSLHRGEGFGLGIAEAMSLGKAVIVTGWSANTEFCNDQNSILVPYSIVKVPSSKKDHIYMENLESWAEPDTNSAALSLKRLYEDRALMETLGKKGREFIAEYFSADNFKKSVVKFIVQRPSA